VCLLAEEELAELEEAEEQLDLLGKKGKGTRFLVCAVQAHVEHVR
jgi:hypothetical protein